MDRTCEPGVCLNCACLGVEYIDKRLGNAWEELNRLTKCEVSVDLRRPPLVVAGFFL